MPSMSPEELAARTGVAFEEIVRWRNLGLLGTDDDPGIFDDAVVERVRLIEFAIRRGIDAEAIANARQTQGDVLGRYISFMRRTSSRKRMSLDEARRAAGIDPDLAQRIWAASGLEEEPDADEQDVEALRTVATALAAGFPEDALLQLVRVYADALGRVAEAEDRLFHFYVHERHRAEGLTGAELVAATDAVGAPLLDVVEPAVLYFHRKAWERAQREDMILHLTEDAHEPLGDTPGQMRVTMLFVDLSRFTALTDAMGDESAAVVVARFSDIARDSVRRHDGRIVKQIGDEFMIVFANVTAAVKCAVDINAAVAVEPQFPAVRVGIHTGVALYREGDYVGSSVNVAARVVGEAQPRQVLVTAAVHDETVGTCDVEFVAVGKRSLRGIAEDVLLYEVRAGGAPTARAVDPVCGMELDIGQVPNRLTWHGRALEFCSDGCLRKFVTAPERYELRS